MVEGDAVDDYDEDGDGDDGAIRRIRSTAEREFKAEMVL